MYETKVGRDKMYQLWSGFLAKKCSFCNNSERKYARPRLLLGSRFQGNHGRRDVYLIPNDTATEALGRIDAMSLSSLEHGNFVN